MSTTSAPAERAARLREAELLASVSELVEALSAIRNAEEDVADVEEYDLAPTPRKRRAAHRKLHNAWAVARALIEKHGA